MTRDEAFAVAGIFRALGGFTEVKVTEFGFQSGNWGVELWSVNARAGNRNLTTVRNKVDEREAKLIARQAKGKANARDKAALSRIAAERALDQE